jgi:hypothetical protein
LQLDLPCAYCKNIFTSDEILHVLALKQIDCR